MPDVIAMKEGPVEDLVFADETFCSLLSVAKYSVHECSESTVAVHVITATLVYELWDAYFLCFSFLTPRIFLHFSNESSAKSTIGSSSFPAPS